MTEQQRREYRKAVLHGGELLLEAKRLDVNPYTLAGDEDAQRDILKFKLAHRAYEMTAEDGKVISISREDYVAKLKKEMEDDGQ